MSVRVVEPLRLGRNRSVEDTAEMDAFELSALETQRAAGNRPYLEFLRVPALSVGLYTLEAGAIDGQSPHTEDEVYMVMTGRARITVGDEVRDVGPGSVVYVAATVPHRFHDIAERLEILVVFAPAEDSLG
jgi:mannose-6-phosphate isomerase-like protein (cupin superfamily)